MGVFKQGILNFIIARILGLDNDDIFDSNSSCLMAFHLKSHGNLNRLRDREEGFFIIFPPNFRVKVLTRTGLC